MEFPEPRDVASLNPTLLFDEGCYNSELDRLTKECLAVLMEKEQKAHVQKLRREFKTPTEEPYITEDFHFHKEELTEKARELAKGILEKERKVLVESKEEYIRNMLEGIYPLMRDYLWKIDEKGNIDKLRFPLTAEQRKKYRIGYLEEQNMSAPARRWLAVQKFMPYLSEETQKLNEKIQELTGW